MRGSLKAVSIRNGRHNCDTVTLEHLETSRSWWVPVRPRGDTNRAVHRLGGFRSAKRTSGHASLDNDRLSRNRGQQILSSPLTAHGDRCGGRQLTNRNRTIHDGEAAQSHRSDSDRFPTHRRRGMKCELIDTVAGTCSNNPSPVGQPGRQLDRHMDSLHSWLRRSRDRNRGTSKNINITLGEEYERGDPVEGIQLGWPLIMPRRYRTHVVTGHGLQNISHTGWGGEGSDPLAHQVRQWCGVVFSVVNGGDESNGTPERVNTDCHPRVSAHPSASQGDPSNGVVIKQARGGPHGR
jgi:hypothetical protein